MTKITQTNSLTLYDICEKGDLTKTFDKLNIEE